jgi:hypothetical protein
MSTNFLNNLIRYIVSEVQDQDGVILRTRLVKLLYLCDVEYYRLRRLRLTDLNWRRYYYGPFAFELQDITQRMGLNMGEEEVDFATGHGVKYVVYDVPNPDQWLEVTQKSVIDRVIKQWGNEDLEVLLDYVYCDTEPMQGAQFRGPLDFRKITFGMRRAVGDELELAANEKDAIKQLVDKHGMVSRKPIAIKPIATKKPPEEERGLTPKLAGKVQSRNDMIKTVEGRE